MSEGVGAQLTRRRLVVRLGAALGAGLGLSACERIGSTGPAQDLLQSTERFTLQAQRLVTDRAALAREYTAAEMSPIFRVNGSRSGSGPEYERHVAEGFANWRLQVGGMVARPLSLSLSQLMAMPRRSQITRHDCVEGWSAIGKWIGVPLQSVLQVAGLDPRTRYILFRCADRMSGGVPYYESIDLIEAFHPQTILAYAMNDQRLPVPHGAPLRLRTERQLGYKHAKFVMAVEAVNELAGIHGGRGGYWEDRGYEWWAGI